MRLDEGNQNTIWQLIFLKVDIEPFIRSDCPIDVCAGCYEWLQTLDDVGHPPYGDDDYRCAICRARLTDFDL